MSDLKTTKLKSLLPPTVPDFRQGTGRTTRSIEWCIDKVKQGWLVCFFCCEQTSRRLDERLQKQEQKDRFSSRVQHSEVRWHIDQHGHGHLFVITPEASLNITSSRDIICFRSHFQHNGIYLFSSPPERDPLLYNLSRFLAFDIRTGSESNVFCAAVDHGFFHHDHSIHFDRAYKSYHAFDHDNVTPYNFPNVTKVRNWWTREQVKLEQEFSWKKSLIADIILRHAKSTENMIAKSYLTSIATSYLLIA